MTNGGGRSCGDEAGTESNNGRKDRLQNEGIRHSVCKRRMRKSAIVAIVMVAVLSCSWIDEKYIERTSSGSFRWRSTIVQVASFAPPLAPKLSASSHNNGFLGSSFHTTKETSAGPLRVASSPTTVNTTAPSTGSPSTSLDKREAKILTSPIKSPIKISGGKSFIPSNEIDQLLDKVDIIALIESYGLQGFSRTSALRATCLCPFHDDNNPSLQINGERGIYKCFSCGAGGNALRFVRAYSEKYPAETRRIKAGIVDATRTNEPLTFVEAIRVLEDCASSNPMVGGVPMRQWSGSSGNNTSSQGSSTKKKNTRQTVGTTSRERILHANLFAAAYFEESLFGLPSAGSARLHLRSRGVHPTTVKAFAMGFAPETYFLSESSKQGTQQKRAWGEGSLVNRLRDEGFTPQEILDAGLAILTRKGREQQEQQLQLHNDSNEDSFEGNNITAASDKSNPGHKDFSTIMDRFRGRLVVPIFDANGKYVLGFGGRILETSQDAQTDFKAAKYLNSPESVVFQKKDILFGNHMVKETVSTTSKKDVSTTESQRRARSLIIVEGYMDAIALWQAGVQETVASMGTALTKEQLLIAAEKARKIGGRVVLCLDNDNAGIAAVKRLCSGHDPILLSVTKKSNIEFFVADLPGSIKDPAEFLEEYSDSEQDLDEKFRAEVIDGAQEWTRWYMNSLVVEHDSTVTGEDDASFSKVFDSVATFLSVFESVDDRMKKAAFIAPKLADLIERDKSTDGRDLDRTQISTTIRIQIASDLVEKAANIIHTKSSAFQRNHRSVVSTEAIVPKSLEIGSDLASSGEIIVPKSLEIGNDVSKEERSRTKTDEKKAQRTNDIESLPKPSQLETSSVPNPSKKWQQIPPAARQDARVKGSYTYKPFRKSMTKHIGGVSATPFDDEWLGVTTNKYTQERIPLRFDALEFNNEKYIGPEEIVRFNKNDYHGTWATPHSSAAGYASQPQSKSLDFLDRGTSSLIESDGKDQSLFVEDLLFSILTRFSEARQSIYDSIRISEASGSNSNVQWSTPEKEWLFKCLVPESHKIPQEIVGLDDISELRLYLSLRPDAFPGAFGSNQEQVSSEEVSKIEVEERKKIAQIGDDPIDALQIPSDEKPKIIGKVQSHQNDLDISDEMVTEQSNQPPMNSIPIIPAIGEEWSDFAQTDSMPGAYDEPMAFGGIDDMLMDSVGPIMESFDPRDGDDQIDDAILSDSHTSEDANENFSAGDSETVVEVEVVEDTGRTDFVDATLVTAEGGDGNFPKDGSLDRFFVEGTEICDMFNKFYADEDTMSLGTNEDKANFAAQDLYTILQFTSVLKRVEAGRKYMRENKEEWYNASSGENRQLRSSTADEDNIAISTAQNIELLEYCSSQNAEVGLRSDLRRLRNQVEKNNQATQRVLEMMDAEFTDSSADLRGYSWLGNVLKFNEMKMLEWNDVIESKESFLPSEEEVEVLEDIVYSDWNELSDESEMWEYDRNVDLNHRSHLAGLVVDPPNSESPDSFAERYEAEWDVESWEQELDQNQGRDEEEWDSNNQQQEYESDEFAEDYEAEFDNYEQ